MSRVELAQEGHFFNKALLPDGAIHWSEAKEHIDENAVIYGEVASTYFDWRKYDRECELWAAYPDIEIKVPPTFIEVGARYPNKELLKVVIWGRDRGRFPESPDRLYKDKAVLITGKPYVYNELVCMNVTCPEDMAIVEPVEGLYTSQDLADPNCRPVFAARTVAEEDTGYRYCEEAPRRVEYIDDWGNDVTEMGDYYYDSEGNCVPDFAVREKQQYPPSWEW